MSISLYLFCLSGFFELYLQLCKFLSLPILFSLRLSNLVLTIVVFFYQINAPPTEHTDYAGVHIVKILFFRRTSQIFKTLSVLKENAYLKTILGCIEYTILHSKCEDQPFLYTRFTNIDNILQTF